MTTLNAKEAYDKAFESRRVAYRVFVVAHPDLVADRLAWEDGDPDDIAACRAASFAHSAWVTALNNDPSVRAAQRALAEALAAQKAAR
jgi:hypothetical protein